MYTALTIDQLIEALASPSANVRWHATWELGRRADTRTLEPLLALLADDDADIRIAVVIALGNLNARRAVPGLVTALEDRDRRVQLHAAHSLALLGDDQGLQTLLAASTARPYDGEARAIAANGLKLLNFKKYRTPKQFQQE